MIRSRKSPLFLVVFVALGATLAGCPKKPAKTTPTPEPTSTPVAEASATPTPDLDAQMKGDAGPEVTTGDLSACGAQPIHFELDSSTLASEASVTLKSVAACLGSHKTWTVQLEGHTDERGSTQYNIALGERRARAVSKYLIDAGVEKSRVETVSYGEEKPATQGHDDVSWAQNRRVEFRIKQK